jgi:Adenosine deaminase z-alpha domain
MSLENKILALLEESKTELPAKVIASSLKVERSLVNRTLYEKLLKMGKVIQKEGTPPLWSCKQTVEEKIAESDNVSPKNVVFIDLGNVHDILPKMEAYADDCAVYAFADRAFNGYGINPPPKNQNITVLKAKDEHKNSADITMIWKAAELVLLHGRKNSPLARVKSGLRFIIFTRDQGFRTLKAILEGYSVVSQVLFVQQWEEAREFIE